MEYQKTIRTKKTCENNPTFHASKTNFCKTWGAFISPLQLVGSPATQKEPNKFQKLILCSCYINFCSWIELGLYPNLPLTNLNQLGPLKQSIPIPIPIPTPKTNVSKLRKKELKKKLYTTPAREAMEFSRWLERLKNPRVISFEDSSKQTSEVDSLQLLHQFLQLD